MKDVVFQIVLLLVGAIIGIVSQIISKFYQKLMLGVFAIALIIVSVGWIGYGLGQNQNESHVVPPTPSNVSRIIDFENGVDETISLDICDAIPPTYYQNCYRASSRLSLADSGFTGKHSLDCQIENIPENEKVYSVNFPIASPPFVDLITANVYIPTSNRFDKIWLLAQLKGEDDQWVFSEFTVDRDGWIYLILDLRQTHNEAGVPANQIGIDEIDIDFFTSRAIQQSSNVHIQIDNIEMHYPASKPSFSFQN